MESKKINQLATEVAPAGTDLTIIGDPITGVSKKITLIQLATTIGAAADLQQVTNNGATTTNPIEIGGLTITGLATGVLKSDSGVISSVPYGAANGVATLGGDGKVPSSQLPSYVDDVIEVANYAALPVTGETGVLYITLDTNRIYRWTGSTYVEIVDTTAVWGAITGTLSNQTDLQNALNLKANDNAVVHLAGTETISGAKTFSNPITISTASYLTSRLKLNNTELAGNNWSISSGNANNSTNNALFTIINETSSTNTFVLSPTGKLAIGGDLGTTNPADDLGIFSTNTNLKIFDITGNGSALNLQATNTSAFISAAYFTTAIPLVLRTGNTDRLTIAANGNSTFANDLTINGSTTGTTGSFASSGSGNTFSIDHGSGSGIALNITKSGNGEGIYVNKTSGTGNAVTIVGTLNATTLVKNGGTSSEFLMADGSVNTSVLPSGAYLPLSGGTLTGALSGTSATFSGLTLSSASTPLLQIVDTTNSKSLLFGADDSNTFIRSSSSTPIFLQVNGGDTAMTLASSGNVGIGTSSPAATLHLNALNTPYRGQLSIQSTDFTQITFYKGATTSTDLIAQIYSEATGNYDLRINNWSSTGALIFGTNSATERMRITSSGNVGIGTSSPGARLDVKGASATTSLQIDWGGSTYGNFIQSYGGGNYDRLSLIGNDILFYGSGPTERMRITSSGNVGIGTSNPANGKLEIQTGASTGLWVQTGGTTSGYVIADFRTGTNASALQILGNGLLYSVPTYNNTSGGAASVGISALGEFYRSTSSLKYKKNVENYTKGLAEVMQMRPVTYNSINEREDGILYAGLIAEEVHDLGLTEFVQYAEDGTPDALAYQNMVSLLVKAIQELKAEIDKLKNK